MYAVSFSKVKVVTQSLKVTGSAPLRRHMTSIVDDELADLKRFQLEDEDHPALTSSEPWSAGLTSVETTTDVRPFQQIPGPRGLPLIGNMLSYSKLGKSATVRKLRGRYKKVDAHLPCNSLSGAYARGGARGSWSPNGCMIVH